jgi:acyl-homoserine-lactone acylase
MKQLLSIFFAALAVSLFSQNYPKINPDNIEIIRDQWGVPHIFAPTDAEVAYGLAWANAQDAFKDMQDLLVIGKGKSGLYQGKEGAKADFFRHVIQAEKTVKEKINEMPDDFLKYIDGYCQGVNAFAEKFPEQKILKQLFPVSVEDVLISYVVALSFMTDAAGAMEKIYDGKLDREEVKGLGSNAYAINSLKSADGSTYLAINPHMRMSGTFHFYEAHLKSEEGLNMYGAIFQGGTSIFMGNNEHLGWSMTWNYFNRGDIYKLQMHPKKKNTYLYDGQWEELETKKITLKVKVGGITIPVPKKSYWSKHGPVLQSNKNKSEYYAFRYPAFMDATAPLQWYKMNKTTNLNEFKQALDMMGIGLFNIIYADKEDNLYYVSYGQVPFREDSIAAMKVLPGSESKYVWKRLHTLKELPHEENPECNYIYNTNNTPFFATCDENENLKLELRKYLDERPGQNNRATVLHTFMERTDKVTFEEFQKIKFDNSYSENSYLMKELMPFFTMDGNKYPEVKELIDLLNNWGKVASPNDISSTILMVTIDKIFKQKKFGDREFVLGFDITEDEFVAALKEAKEWLIKHYGKIEVPLGEVFIAKKGDVRFSSPGFPDALAANYGKKKHDKFIVEAGDTYTQFVRFNKDGVQEIRTLVPFGNSNHPESPYYTNQSPLFQKQQTKPVTMDRATLLKIAREVYHPK